MSKRYPFNGYETMASGYTNGLYLPSKPLDEWNVDECRRALCRQANGDVMHCLECENPCRYGKRIAVLLSPPEKAEERTEKKKAPACQKAGAEANHRKSEIKYMRAIASGDPKTYLQERGMSVHNGLHAIKKRYKNVTPEEARYRLGEMGVEVEETQSRPTEEAAQEQPTMAEEVAPRLRNECRPIVTQPEPNPEPVKCEDVKLLIHALSGEYFRYSCTADGVDIRPNPVCIATAENADAICKEIKAALEMMAG